MKRNIFILFTLTFFNLYSQDISHFKVLSVLDSIPIENAYVSVDNWLNSVTDKQGCFKIYGEYKNIQISHVAYKAKIISYQENNNIIYLEEDNKVLDEVILTNKKKTKVLLPINKYRYRKKHSYKVNQNSVYTTYITNTINSTCYINRIIIEVGDDMNLSRLRDIPFRVNLYTINEKTRLPDKKILDESILTSQNKNRIKDFVYIDIKDFDIEFPKKGIFVAVESLNLLELENFNIFSGQSPSFKAIKNKNKSEYITYDRIYSWDRLTRTKDTIFKDWIDKIIPQPKFIFNFGIEIEY